MAKSIHSYKDLIVWRKSLDLVMAVYELTEHYPKFEMYGLTSQTRRSAISIPSNIAEGRTRGSRKDFRQYLVVAYSSGAELETQIEIAKRLQFGRTLDYSAVDQLLSEVMRMLNSMINKLAV
jgi:four helix bundle protein